jgi:hypothetical protein
VTLACPPDLGGEPSGMVGVGACFVMVACVREDSCEINP